MYGDGLAPVDGELLYGMSAVTRSTVHMRAVFWNYWVRSGWRGGASGSVSVVFCSGIQRPEHIGLWERLFWLVVVGLHPTTIHGSEQG